MSDDTRGVDAVLYALIAVPTLLGLAHHVDHVIRGNHVGWPVTGSVNAFTYSLVIYPVIGLGLYLTVTDRVGARYWVGTAALGAVMMWGLHLSPWAVEPLADVTGPYDDPLAGALALGVLVALICSLVVTTAYATYRWRGGPSS